MNELIINGIDHGKFDLDWARRGGIMLGRDTSDFTCNFARIIHRSINTTNDKDRYTIVEFFKMSPKKGCVVFVPNNYYTDDIRNSFRMATPQECEDAGVEYIKRPVSDQSLSDLQQRAQAALRYAEKLRGIFHVSMLKAYPQKTHQEISDEIDNVMRGEK